MKKYNTVTKKGFLIWIAVLILLFLMSFGMVYAYYTASSRDRSTSVTTGTIRITQVGTDTTIFDSMNSLVTYSDALPGSTVEIAGAVQNSGTNKLYAILIFRVSIVTGQDSGGDDIEEVLCEEYYTATSVKLVYSSGSYNQPATEMTTSQSYNFSFSYAFDFYEYGNSYQGLKIKAIVSAKAIQFDNIENGYSALTMLMS